MKKRSNKKNKSRSKMPNFNNKIKNCKIWNLYLSNAMQNKIIFTHHKMINKILIIYQTLQNKPYLENQELIIWINTMNAIQMICNNKCLIIAILMFLNLKKKMKILIWKKLCKVNNFNKKIISFNSKMYNNNLIINNNHPLNSK